MNLEIIHMNNHIWFLWGFEVITIFSYRCLYFFFIYFIYLLLFIYLFLFIFNMSANIFYEIWIKVFIFYFLKVFYNSSTISFLLYSLHNFNLQIVIITKKLYQPYLNLLYLESSNSEYTQVCYSYTINFIHQRLLQVNY